MKVTCIGNKNELLPSDLLERTRYSDSYSLLTIRKEYLVYAVSQFKGHIWFCIDDVDDEYRPPYYYPSFLFEITDPRLSRFWIFSFIKDEPGIDRPFLGFPEWAHDEYFYYNLIESEVKEVYINRTYRKQMDLEFPDKNVTSIAQIGDENWLMCPDCIDAWEYPDDKNAMVICPECDQIFHNPRYQDNKSIFEQALIERGHIE